MTARCLMVWGTASDAGKSTLVTALARIFVRQGLCVAPFKAQNMARNAYVCADGGEIGVAQAVQAFAARVVPCTDHNPILLKPEPGLVAQVVLNGRSIGRHRFGEYGAMNERMYEAVASSLARLRATHDLVIQEGAGSPAEINLQDRDLANLGAARLGDSDILLVADIDRGGMFASIVGTLALVPDDLRPRVRGVVVNKLRGDASLLDSGLRELEARTGVPVLGVLPHLEHIGLPDEDSLALDRRRHAPRAALDVFEIAVVDFPCLANYEDVLPLESEPGVALRLTRIPREILDADLVVLAGSKSTVHDLAFLRASGIDRALLMRAERGRPILGICGGAQMLGSRIEDPSGVESDTPCVEGLGLLPAHTRFEPEKRTRQVTGSLALGDRPDVRGFFLHHGRLAVDAGALPLVRLADGTDEGARAGRTMGTMMHRLVDAPGARRALLAFVGHVAANAANVADAADASSESLPVDPYDRLADVVAASLDLERIRTHVSGAPS